VCSQSGISIKKNDVVYWNVLGIETMKHDDLYKTWMFRTTFNLDISKSLIYREHDGVSFSFVLRI